MFALLKHPQSCFPESGGICQPGIMGRLAGKWHAAMPGLQEYVIASGSNTVHPEKHQKSWE